MDPAAARQAIEDGNTAWETAALSNDVAALTAVYAEDAVVLAPGAPILSGRAEIEAGFAEMLSAAPFTAIDIVAEGVEVSASGDLAYAYGTFTSTNTVGGQPFEDAGKWTSVHENREGRWVMVLDTWNSSAPMAGVEDASNP
ncbi:MAG: SgcJ/EcaC family oxidoreductase [Gemmatimonadota bacterium]